jgi:hypothetical protein
VQEEIGREDEAEIGVVLVLAKAFSSCDGWWTTECVSSRRHTSGSHGPAQRTVEDEDDEYENEYANSVIRAELFLLRAPLRTGRITKGHQRDGSDTGQSPG